MKYHLGFFSFVSLLALGNVLTSELLQDIDPTLFTFVISTSVMMYALLIRVVMFGRHIDYPLRTVAPSIAALSFTTFAGFFFGTLALEQMSPVLISLVHVTLYPVITSLIAYWFVKGETIRLWLMIPTLLIAIIGITLFSLENIESEEAFITTQGLMWQVISITGWGASIVIAANILRQGTPILDVIGGRFVVTAVILGSYLILSGQLKVHDKLPYLIPLAFLSHFFPFVLSFASVRQLSVITLAIYNMLTPILTYILTAIFFGDWFLSPLQVMGATLIFVALSLRTYNEMRLGQPIQAVSAEPA